VTSRRGTAKAEQHFFKGLGVRGEEKAAALLKEYKNEVAEASSQKKRKLGCTQWGKQGKGQ